MKTERVTPPSSMIASRRTPPELPSLATARPSAGGGERGGEREREIIVSTCDQPMEFLKEQNCQMHSKQLSNGFLSKTIIKHVQNNCQNFMDNMVVKLVQKQLSNSCTFHSHSNANKNMVKLVQKNHQTQEFTMLNVCKFIMVKHTNSPRSKCPHTLLFCT